MAEEQRAEASVGTENALCRSRISTPQEALDADRDLFNAALSLADAERNELRVLVQLYKALGRGWEP